MALFRCSKCSATSIAWRACCPQCQEWDTFAVSKSAVAAQKETRERVPSVLLDSKDDAKALPRLATGISELDRVLGGGIVFDSLVLLGGEPGVGKSTLILEMVRGILRHSPTQILYATGEESVPQVRDRARRLKVQGGKHVFLLAETDLQAVLDEALERKAKCLILDSIQTLRSDTHDSPAGSPFQVKEVAAELMSFAKSNRIACILIGHVTKEGDIAGPKAVEHLVDAVLSFEAPNDGALRVLRASKNRFGSTMEKGCFEMHAQGLREFPQEE